MTAQTPARVFDSLANLTARLGVSGDKGFADTYVYNALQPQELDAAYRTSWLARKIIDIPPFDMTREWRNWQAEGSQIEAIENEEKRLQLAQKTRKGMTWGRLYGGAALVMGVKDGNQPNEPLEPDRVKAGGFQYLHAVSMNKISVGEVESDPLSTNYGAPKFYRLSGAMVGEVEIHWSRVIRFCGAELPDTISEVNNSWGDSVWTSVRDAVRNADLSSMGIVSLLHEAKVDVINIPNLMDLLSNPEYEQRLLRRLLFAQTAKSINNTLLLDKEEVWSRKEVTFSGVVEVLRVFLAVAAGAADIPATRLLGKSPDGMNATGDNDLRNYYDMLSARQNLEMWPALAPLDEVLIRSALGSRPAGIYFESAPLWQMTPAEKATVGKQKADTVAVYAGQNLVPPDALAKATQNMLIEDGTLPGLEQAIEESTEELDFDPIAPPVADPNAPPQVEQQPNLKVIPGGKAADAYNPDQPRDLKGSATGGQWTAAGALGGGGWQSSPLKSAGKVKGLRRAADDAYAAMDVYGAWQEVDAHDLHTTQKTVSAEKVQEYLDNPSKEADVAPGRTGNRLLVAQYKGAMVIIDGNHRAAAAAIRGEKIKAFVVNMDQAYADADRVAKPNEGRQYSIMKAAKMRKAGQLDSIQDATPRSLYVRRDVINADAIRAWAKGQGFETVLNDLHVTIIFSRAAVDWMKVGNDGWGGEKDGQTTIQPGGARLVEKFSDAVVLLFSSSLLSWRHEEMKRAGASFDFSEYQPHITITYQPGDVDLNTIDPYQGPIVLGPEIFEEVDDDYKASITEDSRVGPFDEYNPGQPRDPKGSSTGGQWTKTGQPVNQKGVTPIEKENKTQAEINKKNRIKVLNSMKKIKEHSIAAQEAITVGDYTKAAKHLDYINQHEAKITGPLAAKLPMSKTIATAKSQIAGYKSDINALLEEAPINVKAHLGAKLQPVAAQGVLFGGGIKSEAEFSAKMEALNQSSSIMQQMAPVAVASSIHPEVQKLLGPSKPTTIEAAKSQVMKMEIAHSQSPSEHTVSALALAQSNLQGITSNVGAAAKTLGVAPEVSALLGSKPWSVSSAEAQVAKIAALPDSPHKVTALSLASANLKSLKTMSRQSHGQSAELEERRARRRRARYSA
jgi:phage-related protein (TIGR01555 family)